MITKLSHNWEIQKATIAMFSLKSHWMITILSSFPFNRPRKLAHYPDNKDHGANMGPTWVFSAPGGEPTKVVANVITFEM